MIFFSFIDHRLTRNGTLNTLKCYNIRQWCLKRHNISHHLTFIVALNETKKKWTKLYFKGCVLLNTHNISIMIFYKFFSITRFECDGFTRLIDKLSNFNISSYNINVALYFDCRLANAFSYYGIVLMTTELFESDDKCHGRLIMLRTCWQKGHNSQFYRLWSRVINFEFGRFIERMRFLKVFFSRGSIGNKISLIIVPHD